jgi:hypothetical protein
MDDYDAAVAEEEYEEYEEDLEGELEEEESEIEEQVDIEDASEEAEVNERFILRTKLDLKEKDKNYITIEIVPKNKRIFSEIIQTPEMEEAIGIRASQIEQGSPIFTDVSGFTNPITMARKEFYDRKNPFILERPVKKTDTKRIVEHWKVRKMEVPHHVKQFMIENRILTTNKINELLSKK